ncbi:protein NnrT [Flavimaricola marinus]|uniref:Protein NnrT n=1 Tax=Flavimaricola marinus TaxID=1819565 RepID=A0A238L9K5_9RHOB|nr:protein NnrT [Flavimaricola marinus]SMY06369.1 hypothetical protein LOM8899_00492 [Flavimaricola marinus]
MRFLFPLGSLLCTLASASAADGFDRPIPQAQSATAEFWFALASLALVAALVAVQRLVARS